MRTNKPIDTNSIRHIKFSAKPNPDYYLLFKIKPIKNSVLLHLGDALKDSNIFRYFFLLFLQRHRILQAYLQGKDRLAVAAAIHP